MKKIYLVVPCYNEEEVLCETAKRLELKMKTLIDNKDINEYSRVIFVDDGSKDKTWSIIEELKNNNELFGGIKLSRNRGHQNALLAGLMTVKDECDAVISLDADLQDDINVIDKFIEKFYEGCEVVYGVRSDRKSDTFFKRSTAQGFYKVIKFLGVDIIYNHADYRLMSRKALDSLAEFKEVNLFLRGIVPLVGFKSDIVSYERNERFAGESKYPLKKMISFAFEGITSFSVKPIRLVLVMGIIMFFSSLTALAYFLVTWINGYTVQGWTTVVASIWMLGGIQLLCLGVIGEYVGKIYIEVKSRPKYIIDQFIINSEEK
ncbi:glycosyltransferase family 2 protein [Clostridium gasigenes]|uniref:glycosyltransferase family 2 protein n=1 Tax=Clostridium gasigenes TaxID=94869 RepID=UPI001624CDF1|nr:glycosyltransferase family 2 protein [Clostridium gasigenes]MBB6623203.1 glycosyltransferase family 2 protein [Clostridium gasigenes]MBU3087968.1 glycosyltransferase family 2 protein [Clostridium gasigenes]MBU3104988.1 glycosyltransferase family 2 protein [Clostridium gasigenes]